MILSRLLPPFVLVAAALAAEAQTLSDAPDAPPHPRCLTPLLAQRALEPEKMSPELLRQLALMCNGPTGNDQRPLKSNSILSPSGRFRIHYDVAGRDSVSVRDVNANGIPDYIDSVAFYMDYAWRVEVEAYGFEPPPNDRRGPGPETDVFICELSAEYYGGAQFETDNVVGLDPTRVAGYLLLDNDYKGYPTPGIAGLRVTTAHELHHLIQFGAYRIALPPFEAVAQYTLYEATATWFEKQVHPTLRDYRQYVDAFLREPQDFAMSTHTVNDNVTGYAHMLYLEYLATRFGPDIVHEVWNDFRSVDTYPALDRTLARYNFNLSRSFCEFANWCYYTGYRARDTSLLREAPRLPALRAAGIYPIDDGDAAIEGSLFPLSFGLYRVTVPNASLNVRDTVDFLVTNARSDLGAGGPSVQRTSFRIDVTRTPSTEFIPLARENDTLYYRLTTPAGSNFCLDVIDDSVNVVLGVRTSPQPFINRPGEELLFAIPFSGEQIRDVRIWIYTTSGIRVTELGLSDLHPRDNQLGVLWNGLDRNGVRVASGVYLYEISVNGGPPELGKIAVVRTE